MQSNASLNLQNSSNWLLPCSDFFSVVVQIFGHYMICPDDSQLVLVSSGYQVLP